MEIGVVGLGRMGGNIALRLLRGGHDVAVYDRDPEAAGLLVAEGARSVASLDGLARTLHAPRAIWLMLPSGAPTESTIDVLLPLLEPGDTIIDGANSNYKDSMRRAAMVGKNGITFLDTGTSGGVWGLEGGYCLMVGGDRLAFERLEPVFQTLAPAPDRGYGHVGPSGAGHFVKMVHNGIEYGLMQAYAEGFELLKGKSELDIDVAQVSEMWRYGSVVRSWLLDLAAEALAEDPDLADLAAYVDDSGMGRWTVQESVDLGIPLPAITAALQARFRSRQDAPFGPKLLAGLRNQFGGHTVKKADAEGEAPRGRRRGGGSCGP